MITLRTGIPALDRLVIRNSLPSGKITHLRHVRVQGINVFQLRSGDICWPGRAGCYTGTGWRWLPGLGAALCRLGVITAEDTAALQHKCTHQQEIDQLNLALSDARRMQDRLGLATAGLQKTLWRRLSRLQRPVPHKGGA